MNPEADSKPRVTNACEACRASKVKCIASSQLGICQRCLESKRECFFKTGPRTRRPRQSKLNRVPHTQQAPSPGPSKTFTIDVPLPVEEDPSDRFEALRVAHEQYIDRLLPPESPASSRSCPQMPSSTFLSATALTPSSSTGGSSRPLSSFSVQPQFNIESATQMLELFHHMLPYFPIITLPKDATVSSLSKERPFELLAILAIATGSRSVQGHNLYDEEFRKILGLKFVAGGERTIDLLSGLLIYCAWYPFHLRPRNKQIVQYLRMAIDIIRDLELDQQPEEDEFLQPEMTEQRARGIRAYLGCFYLVAGRAVMVPRTASEMNFTLWLSSCCDMLENSALAPSDRILAWMARYQQINEGVLDLRKLEKDSIPNDYQIRLIVKGLESQLSEWNQRVPEDIASITSIALNRYFAETFLYGAPLLKLPKLGRAAQISVEDAIDSHRLAKSLPALRQFLDLSTSLPKPELTNMSSIDWGRLILAIILGFRVSFPLLRCPQWDAKASRQEFDFGYYITRLAADESGQSHRNLTPATARVADVHTASQIIIESVGKKFRGRLAALEKAAMPSAGTGPSTVTPISKGCPVMDGSLDQYLQVWDEPYVDPSMIMAEAAGRFVPSQGGPGPGFQDLWATMTMSWSRDEAGNMDMGPL